MRYQIRWAGLPLTVYREIAAHLGQVDGVRAELVPQRSRQFNYGQSQIDSLWVHYADDAPPSATTRVEQILAYYSDRYGALEPVELPLT